MPVASVEPEENSETEAMRRVLLQSFEKWLVTGKKVTTEVMLNFKNITTAGEIADIIAGYLTISIDEKERTAGTCRCKRAYAQAAYFFVQRT